MSPERAEHMFNKIEHEVANTSLETQAENKGTPETKAEELFALWQDYRRARVQIHIDRRKARKDKPTGEYKEFVVPAEEKLDKLREALAERWQDKKVQELFKNNITRAYDEFSGVKGSLKDYKGIEQNHKQHVSEREKLYHQIFSHRGQELDELTQIELAALDQQIEVEETKLESAERQNPELAARLSFERIANYRKQLARGGFIWTPSREKYFREIIDHLVVVNQNRPILLSGETGTGKTRLARAISKRLTRRNPHEVGEEAKTDIRPLLGSKAIDAEGSYVNYGQLGQALTGKKDSRDTEAGDGGIFYMDEMNGYPADALRSMIKQISGRSSGEEITFAAWAGKTEQLSHGFGFLGSANLPSEKHPDRVALPNEVARELSELEVDYPPQSADDPELYEMMLAALMDQNSRIRLPYEELAPQYGDIVDTNNNEKHKELNLDPDAGGTLWRFANLVVDIQKSYKGQESSLTPTLQDASYLRAAVLDPGLVLSWLQAYNKSASRQGVDLQTFLGEKLEKWADQKIYPEEDRNLLNKFITKFDLKTPSRRKNYSSTILSPSEIGVLSPRVPREPELLKEAPVPTERVEHLEDGTEVKYDPNDGQIAGSRMFKTTEPDSIWVFLGPARGNHQGEMVMKNDAGEVLLVDTHEWDREWESVRLIFSERFDGKEVKLDILETRELSEQFYNKHDLAEFANAIPKEIKFSKESEARIKEALKMGFDTAMILPDSELQQTLIDKLGVELADKKLAGLAGEDPNQISKNAYFENTTKTSVVKNRPVKRSYMLMYSSGPIPQETKNKNADQLEPLFKQKKWNGMTLPEYLVLQRKEAEERGDHSFDAYSSTAANSYWTWLLDSTIGSDKVVYAGWDPDLRQVKVHYFSHGSVNEGLGGRPVVVIEIL